MTGWVEFFIYFVNINTVSLSQGVLGFTAHSKLNNDFGDEKMSRERNFRTMLENQWDQGNFVCIGLDSDLSKIPEAARRSSPYETILTFNRDIVEATKNSVCAYKPNIAFYEALGGEGLQVLCHTIKFINMAAPRVPVILDCKRADIGNTNRGYATEAFDFLKADAITVHPYLGREALQPFLEKKDKGIIVLCRTSNPGAGEFQNLLVDGSMPLYQVVARKVAKEWNSNGNCAVVVGATYPEELAHVRGIVDDMPILIPGIGKQGGDVEETIKAGKDSRGKGMIINSSRGIIFASNRPDFADAALKETQKLHDEIHQCLQTERERL